jgi:hypothetical protein
VALTADKIDAEIIQWGAHIIVIKGFANCSNCGHISHVEKKIRDDKSIYDGSKGEWLTAKTDSRGKSQKIFTSFVNKETLVIISALLLFWQILIMVVTNNPLPASLFCYKGPLNSVVGNGLKEHHTPFPFTGGRR